MVPFVIAAGLVCLIVGGIWLYRYSKQVDAEADEALAAMERALGATFDRKQRSFSGRLNGRSFSVSEERLKSRGETDDLYVRITIATSAPMTFELHQQTSSFGAGLVGDVEVGDAEFDRQVILRTNDVEKVKRALVPELRRQLADWALHGWLVRVAVRDGQLQYEGGQGLLRKDQIEKTQTIFETMVRLAGALE